MLEPGPRYETPNSSVELHAAELACTQIGVEIVARYIDFFVATGYVPAPVPR